MVDGISNFQIEEAFKNTNDPDIIDNSWGAFPPNHMNKFIDRTSMISQKKGKYPFVIANTNSSNKSSTHGGVYLTLNLKSIFSFLVRLVLIA